jgi:ribosomal protein L11 methyltransferase
MEAYYEFQINCKEEFKDNIIAELAEENFEGFEENENGFSAFIPQSQFEREVFERILTHYNINPDSVPQNTIQQQNWNAQWEASFEPITIGEDIIVKAPFHLLDEKYKYEIIIQPKNTFGTGHHETTQLVLQMMLQTDFKNKSVFDYGCGTGVLSIFASMLKADKIFAIDIDEWSAENIIENCSLNSVINIEFKKSDLAMMEQRKFDVVLANINKNILLGSFDKLSQMMNSNAKLIISGFYETDLDDLKNAAEKFQLNYKVHIVKNNWCAAKFVKN